MKESAWVISYHNQEYLFSHITPIPYMVKYERINSNYHKQVVWVYKTDIILPRNFQQGICTYESMNPTIPPGPPFCSFLFAFMALALVVSSSASLLNWMRKGLDWPGNNWSTVLLIDVDTKIQMATNCRLWPCARHCHQCLRRPCRRYGQPYPEDFGMVLQAINKKITRDFW